MRVLHKLKYQHAAQIKHTAHYLESLGQWMGWYLVVIVSRGLTAVLMST